MMMMMIIMIMIMIIIFCRATWSIPNFKYLDAGEGLSLSRLVLFSVTSVAGRAGCLCYRHCTREMFSACIRSAQRVCNVGGHDCRFRLMTLLSASGVGVRTSARNSYRIVSVVVGGVMVFAACAATVLYLLPPVAGSLENAGARLSLTETSSSH